MQENDRWRQVSIQDAVTPLENNSVHVWQFAYHKSRQRSPFVDLLSHYAGLRIQAQQLQSGSHGKPFLPSIDNLSFNWSHSGNTAVFAIAKAPLFLGVDIEYVKLGRPYHTLAKRFFSQAEARRLDKLAADKLAHRFIKLWNAKEALLKAYGHGLSYGLENIILDTDAQGHTIIGALHGAITQHAPWQLEQINVQDDAYLALAWSGHPRHIQYFKM